MECKTRAARSLIASFRVSVVLLLVLLVSCKTPKQYRHEADSVVEDIVEQTQRQALGATEPFTIEQPAQTLRRRLLLDQKLPFSDAASLGSKDVEPIEQWPDDDYLEKATREREQMAQLYSNEPLRLTLFDALQVGARNSREYQSQKELIFEEALQLDLERDAFRNTWTGFFDSLISADLSDDPAEAGIENTFATQLDRQLESGAAFSTSLAVDLVKLLTMGHSSSLGLVADATVAIPLMRGSGRFVVTEPLTQSERNVVYAIYQFERFKRTFAVQIASDYLKVLQQLDQVENAAGNYKLLVTRTRHERRLAVGGRRSQIQIDQAKQAELRARDRWIVAQQAYQRQLDGMKRLLGLPTDARIELDSRELKRLDLALMPQFHPTEPPESSKSPEHREIPSTEQVAASADAPVELVPPNRQHGGPLELDEATALPLAIKHRLDLRVAIGRVFDAQRTVAVAADTLRADLTLLGSGSFGEQRTLANADLSNAELRPERGSYSVLASLDLPFERTAERNLYRSSLINLEQSVRDVQALEDQVKFQVRDELRDLLVAREGVQIQAQAVKVAERRVHSTQMFLDTLRPGVQIRDVLDAVEDLNGAQNALSASLVNYRIAELQLQRDLGLLEVNEQGLWQEYNPEEDHDET